MTAELATGIAIGALTLALIEGVIVLVGVGLGLGALHRFLEGR